MKIPRNARCVLCYSASFEITPCGGERARNFPHSNVRLKWGDAESSLTVGCKHRVGFMHALFFWGVAGLRPHQPAVIPRPGGGPPKENMSSPCRLVFFKLPACFRGRCLAKECSKLACLTPTSFVPAHPKTCMCHSGVRIAFAHVCHLQCGETKILHSFLNTASFAVSSREGPWGCRFTFLRRPAVRENTNKDRSRMDAALRVRLHRPPLPP